MNLHLASNVGELKSPIVSLIKMQLIINVSHNETKKPIKYWNTGIIKWEYLVLIVSILLQPPIDGDFTPISVIARFHAT